MLDRIDWQRAQAIAICTLVLLVVLWALGQVLALIAHALLLFALGAVLAFVLAPIVDLGARRRVPRPLMVALTYFCFLIVCVVGVALIAAPLIAQVSQLIVALPQYTLMVNDGLLQLDRGLIGTPFEGSLAALKAQAVNEVGGLATGFLTRLVGALSSVGGGASDGILVLIISIYMLAAAPLFDRSMLGVLPERQRTTYVFLRDSVTQVLGGYLRSQLVLALILGVVVAIGLQLMGVPYSLLLAVLATVLGLIPMFGSALSALPALAVALFQPFPTVVWVLIFFVVVQNIQDQVLAPRITGNAVGLHPLAVMFALVAGFELAGFVGALFGLPVAGLVWVLVVAIWRAVGPAARAASPPEPALVEVDASVRRPS